MSLQSDFDDEMKENVDTNSKVSEASKHLSIIDEQWELIDPIPDIHALFIEYDEKFFYGKLKSVEIKWSQRMTTCAGVCCYQGRGGLCSIRLSVPLLKLRPRKDLVETLLHEMIHAYLFVTHNYKDHSAHGPEFLMHMHRINKESGTNITVFHNFHAEVNLYKQHWWKCDGPCRNKSPYFGLVKRSMNRAPGPYDRWWADHQFKCGGQFVKIKEPSKFSETKTQKKRVHSDSKKETPLSDIRKFIKVGNPVPSSKPSDSSIDMPNLSVPKLISPNKDSLVGTEASRNFVPFIGTGHRLGSVSGITQVPSHSSSKSLKNLHFEYNRDLPSTSSGITHSKSAKIPRMSSTSDIQNVPKGHASISSSASLSDLRNFVKKSLKIPSSTCTSSSKAKELNQGALEKVLLPENTSDYRDYVQENSTNSLNFQNSVSTKLSCPICFNLVEEEINSHLDKCLKKSS